MRLGSAKSKACENRTGYHLRTLRGRLAKRNATGVVVLELILSLPLLFIVLLAIVEFGAIMANLQAVAIASREGGRYAARSVTLNAATASEIRDIVDRRLQSAGFGPNASEGVVLVHNIGGLETHTDGTCPAPAGPPLPVRSVRVRACVPLDRLGPNLLAPLGFNLSSMTVEQDTTFDYEF